MGETGAASPLIVLCGRSLALPRNDIDLITTAEPQKVILHKNCTTKKLFNNLYTYGIAQSTGTPILRQKT